MPHHNWSFSFVLPVKENVITTEDGESLIERDLVKVAPLVKSPGYSLQNEDLSVYSDGEDFDSFCPDREWPDEELVNQPAPASTSQPTQPSSPTLTASDSQVKKLLESGGGVKIYWNRSLSGIPARPGHLPSYQSKEG